MANNENINKVVYGNETLIDLTQDSVTPQTLLEGETAHDRSGAQITGTAKQGHSILNRIATALTQRAKLWFVDAEVTDDSTNGRTKVEIIKDGLTETQFDALSLDGSADGEYLVEGEGETYFDSTDIKHGNGTVKSELDKLNADITTVEVETLTKNGDTIRFNLKNGVCSFYGDLTHLSSSDTVVIFGILPAKFKPINRYAIFNPFSKASPYSSLENTSLWVSNNTGEVNIYKPSATTGCYVSGTYMVI